MFDEIHIKSLQQKKGDDIQKNLFVQLEGLFNRYLKYKPFKQKEINLLLEFLTEKSNILIYEKICLDSSYS